MPKASDAKTILIVEDNEAISGIFHDLLEMDGYTVCCCGNGTAALELAKETSFGIVIVDYHMPGMNGAELTRWLRARCPDALIVGISGGHAERAFLDAGADAFFKKPFAFRDLVSLINNQRPD